MTTLREITVQWKVEVDDSALKGAAKKIAALNAQLRRLDKTALQALALGTGAPGTAAGRPARAKREIDATTKAFEKQLKVKEKIAKVEKQSLMEARKTGTWRRAGERAPSLMEGKRTGTWRRASPAAERQQSLMEARKTGVFRRASPAAERAQSLMEAKRTGVFRRAAPAAVSRRMPESGMLNRGFDLAAAGASFGDAQRERAEREASRIRANAAKVEARAVESSARRSAAARRAAERRSQQSRDAAGSFALGALGAAAGVGYAGWSSLQRGVDARETETLLGTTFGADAGAVMGRADATAGAMGRSKYAMRQNVGQFGAFLTPQLKGTGADIGGMSQQLSQLAVDLASFYNVSEKEASTRLFSGMAGETEAVRRLGVDLSDASLEALAQSKGITTAYNQLTQPEKTMLRFEKLLADTTLAQGDAIRTSGDLANMQRALASQFEETVTELGSTFIPRVKEWAMVMKNDGIPIMKRFVVQTRGLESAFEYLGVAAMGVAGAFVAASPALAAGLAALGASLLAFDDIRATQEGKGSVLGDFAKGLNPNADPAFGMDRIGTMSIGGADVAIAGLRDLFGGNLFTGMKHTKAAMGRFSQSWNGADNAAQERLDKRYRLAASGDTAAFGAAGGTTQEYLDLRRTAIGRGEILPTAQDAADGVVAAQTMGPASPAQALAANMGGVQVRVNVDKAFATPEQLSAAIAEAMATAMAQTKASVGEEYSTQNYGED